VKLKILIGIIGVFLVTAIGVQLYMNSQLLPFDDEARKKAPYNMIKLSDGYTHYRHSAGDGQTVVLIHGSSTPLFMWNGIFESLAETGMNVIAYDQYGRGWSDRPEIDYNYELYDRQLDELIKALNLQTPVDMVGTSWGAMVTAYYVEHHPDNVRKVGLISPGGYMKEIPLVYQLMRAPILGDWVMDVFGKAITLAPVKEAASLEHKVPDILGQYEQMVNYQGYLTASTSLFRNIDFDRTTQSYKSVGESGKPTQVIWGSADPLAVNEPSFGRDIPQAEQDVIEDAGHIVPLSHDDTVSKILIGFLQK
jgi:pimeloyl-ACP methyl ester carboxylesterase